MPRPRRSEVVPPKEVGLYHCVNRCVRRAFLCGVDRETGRSFEHRREWIEARLRFLAGAVGIDVCGYAILSNHIHVVLRNRPDLVESWSDDEVRRRWWSLCPLRREADGSPAEPRDGDLTMLVPDEKLSEIRERLSSVSWFMRFLCEPIARRANREDGVTGRFWEGRFKCQPLLDESAVLACSMYVDLNPIRAGMAASPETSRFTSAHRRIEAVTKRPGADDFLAPISLLETGPENESAESVEQTSNPSRRRASNKGFLPMTLAEYLRLLDWTGRQVRRDKRAAIPADLAPLLARMQLAESTWIETVLHFGRLFRSAAGRPSSLAAAASRTRRRWLHGTTASRRAFQGV